MRKSRKLLPGLVILVLVLALAVGGVYSYMFARTQEAANVLTPATVSCEVEETFKNNEKTSIAVKNTGKVDAYLRVRLVTYWVNGDGEIVARPSAKISFLLNDSDWLSDLENDTYYYKYKVKPNQLTTNLLDELSVITLVSEDGYKQVIEVFAEAIQAEGTTDENVPAVTDAWGVTITDGVITAVN